MQTNTAYQAKKNDAFHVQAFLDSVGVASAVVVCKPNDVIYFQGDVCRDVLYIQQGRVKVSVVSQSGKEAVVAILNPGDFVGEGALLGQSTRIATATAATPATLLVIGAKEMLRAIHEEHAFSDRFISYLVERNLRIEEDFIDQLFNSSEKRLARTLLLLARFGNREEPPVALPKISQQTLAEMIGTTRSRVNFFMKKFEKMGFINLEGGLHVNDSLLDGVLHDN